MWCVAELNEEYIFKIEMCWKATRNRTIQPNSGLFGREPVTLPADVRPPRQPSRGGKRDADNDYDRRGTANVFCAVEPTAGRHFTFATPHRSAFEFARGAGELAIQYRDADTVHPVLDNLNIHCLKSLTDAFGVEISCEVWDRFMIHLTLRTEAGSTRPKSKSAAAMPRQTPDSGFDFASP